MYHKENMVATMIQYDTLHFEQHPFVKIYQWIYFVFQDPIGHFIPTLMFQYNTQ